MEIALIFLVAVFAVIAAVFAVGMFRTRGQAQEKFQTQIAELAGAREREGALREKLAAQQAEIEAVRARMQADFELLAQKIFEHSQQKLVDSSGATLAPLRERLHEFSQKIESLNVANVQKQAELKEQILTLTELNKRMNKEAEALTRALKSDNKAAGNWGEMVLENLLELCGLTKGREYDTQVSAKNEAGDTQRPDVIVRLPENKFIIIDSKVSLLSYSEYSRAATDAQGAPHLKAFIDSVREHISALGKKEYWKLRDLGSTPDYVLLFLPIEQAFHLLIEKEPQVYEYALEKKIILTAPSTLLATLKTVDLLWRTDTQNKNTLQITKVGQDLREEIERFFALMEALGKQIDRTQEAYQQTRKKLYTGERYTLKRIADRLVELGIKAEKNLPIPEEHEEERPPEKQNGANRND